MAETEAKSFEEAVSSAASMLVSIRHEKGGTFVTTPLAYPSGGAVVIWVDRAPPHFLVSDYSFAARECEIMGADRRQFMARAEAVAMSAGVEIASDGAFQVQVSEGQLVGAIKAIANCSLEVAINYANRQHQRKRADAGLMLHQKLVRLYGEQHVAKEFEFRGASTTAWSIDVAVTNDDTPALFDTVTPWFPSVASTLAKFGDIRLLDNPPARTAVLSTKDGFGSWITALAQTGNVLQAVAPDDAFRRAVLH
ncbi:hypothetical protein [Sandarakinorhabdus sp.]|uniref:hypothetical protein n=1 Tax=Sandarakinorhabdus sp. TaxID=1916663 RepID=UPI00286DE9DF|nr:hypothetical protein [Sandarakinorhabdus sp.]